jgi:hypothetical protein
MRTLWKGTDRMKSQADRILRVLAQQSNASITKTKILATRVDHQLPIDANKRSAVPAEK